MTLEHGPTLMLAPEQALSAMWQLALDAWALTNRPLPTYSRAETPLKRLVLGSAEPGGEA